MSSLRNATKRRDHKERSQPAARSRLGILEKKNDYLERARDHNKKRDRLKILRKKAADRNPDEFATGMVHSKVVNKVHREDTTQASAGLSHAEMRLLKSQDAAYTHMRRAIDERNCERLRSNLHMINPVAGSGGGGGEYDSDSDDGGGGDGPTTNRHTLFLENGEACDVFDPAEHFGTEPEHAHNPRNRPRSHPSTAAATSSGGDDPADLLPPPPPPPPAKPPKKLRRKLEQRNAAMYEELRQRRERSAKLAGVLTHMQTEKNLMGSKGQKRKVKDAEGGKPAVFRWKRQRQK